MTDGKFSISTVIHRVTGTTRTSCCVSRSSNVAKVEKCQNIMPQSPDCDDWNSNSEVLSLKLFRVRGTVSWPSSYSNIVIIGPSKLEASACVVFEFQRNN
jgi:hypothetical protein